MLRHCVVVQLGGELTKKCQRSCKPGRVCGCVLHRLAVNNGQCLALATRCALQGLQPVGFRVSESQWSRDTGLGQGIPSCSNPCQQQQLVLVPRRPGHFLARSRFGQDSQGRLRCRGVRAPKPSIVVCRGTSTDFGPGNINCCSNTYCGRFNRRSTGSHPRRDCDVSSFSRCFNSRDVASIHRHRGYLNRDSSGALGCCSHFAHPTGSGRALSPNQRLAHEQPTNERSANGWPPH